MGNQQSTGLDSSCLHTVNTVEWVEAAKALSMLNSKLTLGDVKAHAKRRLAKLYPSVPVYRIESEVNKVGLTLKRTEHLPDRSKDSTELNGQEAISLFVACMGVTKEVALAAIDLARRTHPLTGRTRSPLCADMSIWDKVEAVPALGALDGASSRTTPSTDKSKMSMMSVMSFKRREQSNSPDSFSSMLVDEPLQVQTPQAKAPASPGFLTPKVQQTPQAKAPATAGILATPKVQTPQAKAPATAGILATPKAKAKGKFTLASTAIQRLEEPSANAMYATSLYDMHCAMLRNQLLSQKVAEPVSMLSTACGTWTAPLNPFFGNYGNYRGYGCV